MNKNSPIGIFDSGVGGFTVIKEILKELPNESLIYLGDTARIPYGTRSKGLITKFSLEMVSFLLKHQIKFLVVACNTISATCLKEIQNFSHVPVLGVINPAAKYAVDITKTQHIGVIGTRATIASGIYEKEIMNLNPDTKVLSKSCPLFIHFAEEGFTDHPALKYVAEDYLKKFTDSKIDTLILGCTHYPLLRDTIQDVVGKEITLIDSAGPTAKELRKILAKKNLLSKNKEPEFRFYVTDAPERAKEIAEKFFGEKLPGELKLTHQFLG